MVFPMVENCRGLSLELMSFDVAPEQQLYTSQGVAVAVEAVSQIKVKSDPLSIRTASEQFLTKPPAEREAVAPESVQQSTLAMLKQPSRPCRVQERAGVNTGMRLRRAAA